MINESPYLFLSEEQRPSNESGKDKMLGDMVNKCTSNDGMTNKIAPEISINENQYRNDKMSEEVVDVNWDTESQLKNEVGELQSEILERNKIAPLLNIRNERNKFVPLQDVRNETDFNSRDKTFQQVKELETFAEKYSNEQL